MKQIGSVTTITQKEQPSKIGTQVGEHGSATSDASKVAAYLSRHSPEDMDKAAVSRASQHNVGLLVRYDHRFPTGPNGENLPSYTVAVGCEVHGDDANRKAALADLENFITPAPIRQIEAWLAELSVICAKRRDGDFDEGLRLTAYASRLNRYPADVVKYALLDSSWQFWPTWAELEKICNAKAGPRKHMIHALKNPAPAFEIVNRPPTEEEKARVQALVDEMFPSISKDWKDRAVDEAMKGDCMKDEARRNA